MNVARLILPAIRWPEEGADALEAAWRAVKPALDAEVGGFILFGGGAEGVAALARRLHESARHPLLLAADAERGAGQQFRGATTLPPPAALASLDDPLDAAAAAAWITAAELGALGLNWALAPVADLDLEPRNPIVGTRAFGAEPVRAADCVHAWVRSCQAKGVLACAKHFPGHGRTTTDSHLELPDVRAGLGALEADLCPFRAAIDAGVASLMGAHVAYPALDSAGAPATLSRPILTGLLRERLGFDGLVVTDALTMEGVLRHTGTEAEAAVRALDAGTDLLLYPRDWRAVLGAVEEALAAERLDGAALERSLARVDRALERASEAAAAGAPQGAPTAGAAEWALDTARRAVTWLRRRDAHPRPERIELAIVDDDVLRMTPQTLAALGLTAPPDAPPRAAFAQTLRARGYDLMLLDDADPWSGAGEPVVACFADVRGYKGRAGVSHEAEAAVARRLRHRPDAILVLFGHPRHAAAWPGARAVACAWGGDDVMQRAAAHALADAWERGQGREARG